MTTTPQSQGVSGGRTYWRSGLTVYSRLGNGDHPSVEFHLMAATTNQAQNLDEAISKLNSHSTLTSENARLAERVRVLEGALDSLVNAWALKDVRGLVAGWNGEGTPYGPYERHPSKLGATLPKTNCGAVYELDDAMCRARSALLTTPEAGE